MGWKDKGHRSDRKMLDKDMRAIYTSSWNDFARSTEGGYRFDDFSEASRGNSNINTMFILKITPITVLAIF